VARFVYNSSCLGFEGRRIKVHGYLTEKLEIEPEKIK
jgi:hypothetical protein